MAVTIVDGSLDFSGGVDSIKVTTIQSQANPNGLARNQLAWLTNATTRDGGITQRTGWNFVSTVTTGTGLFQGKYLYEPDEDNPYFIYAIAGHILKVVPGSLAVVDLSVQFNLFMPATQPYFYFVQGEQFLIIQAGDFITLPLFWDGTTLRRSKGITNTGVAPGTPGVNEIPAAGPMDYYMNRIWYAQGRQYSAGDIVGGNSGTLAYQFRDSILNVTENPLVLGGDGFTVPTNAGNIRALKHNANLDSATGQGQLFVFTRRAVYALIVPITRTDWINANSNNQPQQVVVQLVNGSVNDRSVVAVNGDLYFQSLEPAIRSLISAIRYFQQPGNTGISAQEERLFQFVDRSLLKFCSGTAFDNRLLQATLPVQRPQGVVCQAIVPLDFLPMSEFQGKYDPVWEGMYEGLDVFQLATGDFGGLERCFATVLSRETGAIELWELTNSERFDVNVHGEARATWIIEFPAFTWGKEFQLKRLVCGEFWIDKLFGTVEFTMFYRPDGDTCWHLWHRWQMCTARNSCEDVTNPVCYPLVGYRESYKQTITLPVPPATCEETMGRPSDIGYQFQAKLVIKGWCRVRGLLLHAEDVLQKLYHNLVCGPQFRCAQAVPTFTPPPAPPAPPTPPAPPGYPTLPITKIDPIITWNDPADINTSIALSGTQLNATANVPGTFVYNPPAGTFLSVGPAQPLQTTFTPTDTTHYNVVTKTVHINVTTSAGNAWADRVVINGGVRPSNATINAADTFWNSLGASIQSQVITLNFFAPDNLIACLTPFIKGPGNDPWTNHNFVGADLSVTGLQGNGTTKYLDTGITWANTAAIYGSNKFGTEIGSRSNKANYSGFFAGTYDGVNGTSVLFVNLQNVGPVVEMDYWGAAGSTAQPVTTGSFLGLQMGERYDLSHQTNFSYMSDNVGVYTFFTNIINNVAAAELLTALPIFLYCANGGTGVPGTPGGFLNVSINWCSMTTGLNAADAQTFAVAARTLRDTLGASWN